MCHTQSGYARLRTRLWGPSESTSQRFVPTYPEPHAGSIPNWGKIVKIVKSRNIMYNSTLRAPFFMYLVLLNSRKYCLQKLHWLAETFCLWEMHNRPSYVWNTLSKTVPLSQYTETVISCQLLLHYVHIYRHSYLISFIPLSTLIISLTQYKLCSFNRLSVLVSDWVHVSSYMFRIWTLQSS